MKRELQEEVTVLGGGPAGSTAACILARHGHPVTVHLQEPRGLPADERWETLSPGALGLLELHHREVWPAIQDLLVPCRASVAWSREDIARQQQDAGSSVVAVDRARLDPLLRSSAAMQGAVLLQQPAPVGGELNETKVRGIDAGGRFPAIPAPREEIAPRTLALTAQVAGLSLAARSTHLESLTDGWLWAARIAREYSTVTLFVSPRDLRGRSRKDHSQYFLEVISRSSLSPAGTTPVLHSALQKRDATPAARPPVHTTWLRAGDAALALDPLSGQGLQHALLSGAQVAIALHTIRMRDGSSELAQDFLRARHAEAKALHTGACRDFYRRQDRFTGEFWQERTAAAPLSSFATEAPPSPAMPSIAEARLMLCPQTSFRDTPVVAGDFIESQAALFHPALKRPVAFLEGRAAFELLRDLPDPLNGPALLRLWEHRAGLSPAAARRALAFLLGHRVLTPC